MFRNFVSFFECMDYDVVSIIATYLFLDAHHYVYQETNFILLKTEDCHEHSQIKKLEIFRSILAQFTSFLQKIGSV